MSYDAILLMSFGGPEGPDDVMPFLENVTRGRDVPRERLEEVSHHYLALGGVSPINDQNRELLSHLKDEMARRNHSLPIYWGNRNWDPYIADVLKQMDADGVRTVLMLATSAYSSYSGCRQYREDLGMALTNTGLAGTMKVDKLRHYFDHPGFITPFIEGLVEALTASSAAGHSPQTTHIFFTTHSIPNAMGESSGPPGRFDGVGGAYVAQHLAAAELVVAGAKEHGITTPAWSLVYQSRSGPAHVPWLEPDINDALRDAKESGMTCAIVVPLGFVSDHVEVIWDLDNEAKETCDELGVHMLRVATPGTHPLFVSGLVDLIEARMADETGVALSSLGPWPSVCAPGCCKNLRREVPHIAGEDSAL
jgi:protoporphyrin/coproporphyrin ferrochelatase